MTNKEYERNAEVVNLINYRRGKEIKTIEKQLQSFYERLAESSRWVYENSERRKLETELDGDS